MNPNTTVQHFYLRLSNDGKTTKHGVPIPAEYLGQPVGVIAFRAHAPGIVAVSGSMVSRKDTFVKRTGVAKAHGRLADDDNCLHISVDELKQIQPQELVAQLGLMTRTGNHFNQVNWSKAQHTKASAIESFEARQAQVPA